MALLHLTDWPFRQGDISRRADKTPATARHDIALARYLERQRACRLTAMSTMDLGGVVRRLLALATPFVSILSTGVLKEHLRRR
ncbi:MAG: hypothetical protein E5V92_18325 [Mesorhizobium sp.]|uniref:hypothetical protein n=1 Tax=unclassified Mesorhizobium TaxID=325217 RepID=UPI000F7580E0|nr:MULTISPECIES: hypothetical protein [unclassified Mesorhizobium]AZO70346.1 hypothetical protein EJ067_03435 [Mesorhizobium sp. M1D.F.Ca.ET.043.01.1.1]RWA92737.1 MAG: hypothetical protein EOQ32_15745 [Mesorhizobium sp.]RWE15650.1 MAG: hypothetical protein EOS61_08975 [Mesorhizobium sp.]TJW83477.1 MAG: hypothetical protein E5V92_18325 [Mesorhizobium sp.]